MNVCELLRLLQTEHDETAARADNLRKQIERLTTALAETEARPSSPPPARSSTASPHPTTNRPPRRPPPPPSTSAS
ncbi:hypothetical protein [Streptomyces sp. NPDC057557]|uniref:hypothetical protein n=1 Tax=Streptomyces sp. NPDC057557 TaxID=3346167 RepID=UPI00368519A0